MPTEGVKTALAITTSIEHLDFQIDTFSETVVMVSNKIAENLLPPVLQRFHKKIVKI